MKCLVAYNLFLLLLISLVSSCAYGLVLQNKNLEVYLDDDLPRVNQYLFRSNSSNGTAVITSFSGFVSGRRWTLKINSGDITAHSDTDTAFKWQPSSQESANWILAFKAKSFATRVDVTVTITGAVTLVNTSFTWALRSVQASDNYNVSKIHFDQGFEFVSLQIGDAFWRDTWYQTDYQYQDPGGLWGYNLDGEYVNSFSIPEQPQQTVYVGGFKYDSSAGFAMDSSRYILPFSTRKEGITYPDRTEVFSVSASSINVVLRCGVAPAYTATIHFWSDLNGDDTVNFQDIQLSLRRQAPMAAEIYRTAVAYKLGLDYQVANVTNPPIVTFRGALEYIRLMALATDNMPQLVYLVGWQFDGHDSGYPALNQLNPALGTMADFQYLVKQAAALYNTVISFHINVDDAYAEIEGFPNPEFKREILDININGDLLVWAHDLHLDPSQGLTYHISKTKDVMTGNNFRRLQAFIDLVNPTQAVHLDAWRCINLSWENGSYINMDDEMICGCQPQLQFLRQKGLAPGIEGNDGTPMKSTALVDYYWHMDTSLYFLYFGRVAPGGSGGDPLSVMFGTSIDNDYTGLPSMQAAWQLMCDDAYLKTMLYTLYQTDEWIDIDVDGNGWHIMRFANGALAAGYDGNNFTVNWPVAGGKNILVANGRRRFLPRDDGTIYIYMQSNMKPEQQTWTLPASWARYKITADTLSFNGIIYDTPTFSLSSDGLTLTIPVTPGVPIRLSKL